MNATDFGFVAGALSVVVGVALIFVPAALIVAGLAAATTSVVAARRAEGR